MQPGPLSYLILIVVGIVLGIWMFAAIFPGLAVAFSIFTGASHPYGIAAIVLVVVIVTVLVRAK